MVSNERAALIDFMAQDNTWGIGKFIAGNKKLQADLLEFNADVDINLLVEHLQAKGKKQQQARTFIDDYLEARGGKMPMDKLPLNVRLSAGLQTAKEEFQSGIHKITRRSMILGAVDLTAAAISVFGFTKRERQLAFGVGTLALMSSMANTAQAAISHDDVHSKMHDFNKTAYSDTSSPIQITISGGQVEFQQAQDSEYYLNPFLAKRLQDKEPLTMELMPLIFDAANKNGLDPILLANLMFHESMGFQKDVIYGPVKSSAGAMGVAQITPGKGKEFGLTKEADFFNPVKEIPVAARIISDFMAKHDIDQVAASGTYNGGWGGVLFAMESLGVNDITGRQYYEFLKKRYEEVGNTDPGAWHMETRKYIGDITGWTWEEGHTQWAVKLQGDNPLQFVENALSGNAALAAANQMALDHNG